MTRRWLMLTLLPLALLLGVACGGGDDDGDAHEGGSEPTTAATSANTAAPSAAATEEPTEEPTEVATEEAPSPLVAIDGLTCSGGWENLTFGSTGSFEVVFAVNDAGDGGVATLSLGGNVFGAQGGTVEVPFTLQGANAVIDSDADFLGHAKMSIGVDGAVQEAVFEAPPAFGTPDSKVTLEEFAFDGSTLTTKVKIDFGAGSGTAESVVTSSCS